MLAAENPLHAHISASCANCPLLQFYFRRSDLARLSKLKIGPDVEQLQVETVEFPEFGKRFCSICYTGVPNIITVPCFHLASCRDCAIELEVRQIFILFTPPPLT
jgi:Zinc finger, C3HC4 type (RING finger)